MVQRIDKISFLFDVETCNTTVKKKKQTKGCQKSKPKKKERIEYYFFFTPLHLPQPPTV